jgi:UDP-glucose-4-epimerase GalE
MSRENMGDRVLITGGGGFIGSHAAKALLAAGFEPIVFDNFCRGHRSLVRFGPLIEDDILDRPAVERAIEQTRPIACIHFAAFAYVAESVEHPDLYYWNNVAGSLSLIRALIGRGVDKIVFSSTCAIYGEPQRLPIGEETAKLPISPYGRSKLVVEQMLSDFDAAHGLKSVSLRYFNAAGADPAGLIGEMHDPEPHIIPRTLMSAAGHIPNIQINGTDYPTRDGTAIRDYTHVADLADAHVLALRYLLDGGQTDAFNLGTGYGYSVRDIVDSAGRITGRTIPVVMGPRRAGDPAEVVADPAKARRILAFSPRYTELDQMMGHAWRWFETRGFRHG